LASYDAGTLNWQHRTIFENSPAFLEKLGLALQESNIKPEIEIFDAGMIYNAIYYIKKGILKPPCHFQLVLGCAGGMANTVENLVFLKSLLPEGSTWAGCGISSGHMPIMLATIAMGVGISASALKITCIWIRVCWQNPMLNWSNVRKCF